MSEASGGSIRQHSSWMVLGALLLGLLLGAVSLRLGDGFRDPAIRVMAMVGGLWLDALKMTVVPLIIALLITGIVGGADAAGRAGCRPVVPMVCRRADLVGNHRGVATPLLLQAFPLPQAAAEALRAGLAGVDANAAAASVPTISDWLKSVIPTNPIAAAANDKILAMVVFTALFAFAVTRIAPARRRIIADFFKAVEEAMLVMVGWVLWLAPAGVFALAFAVGAGAGGAAFGAVLHYVLLYSLVGVIVLLIGYVIAVVFARWRLGEFARAIIPAQAVAISTQSSLASLPAMLTAARGLGVPERTADVTLPLSVALFRSTGPAMNIAVAIYVAYWLGIPLGPGAYIAGIAVASIASYWAVSLPGALSFVTSIAPIALAMGVPIEPLALLIAVEVVPDIIRTVGNVTMDVAVTGAVARSDRQRA